MKTYTIYDENGDFAGTGKGALVPNRPGCVEGHHDPSTKLIDGKVVAQEIDTALAQKKLRERQIADLRIKRTNIFAVTVDKINAVRWHTMTEAKRGEWLTWYQMMLDITESASNLENPDWPKPPAM